MSSNRFWIVGMLVAMAGVQLWARAVRAEDPDVLRKYLRHVDTVVANLETAARLDMRDPAFCPQGAADFSVAAARNVALAAMFMGDPALTNALAVLQSEGSIFIAYCSGKVSDALKRRPGLRDAEDAERRVRQAAVALGERVGAVREAIARQLDEVDARDP